MSTSIGIFHTNSSFLAQRELNLSFLYLTAKSLVFSQFGTSLKYLQELLPRHGFQFRTLSGDMSMRRRAEALHSFENDPPTTVFLLSMRAAAVGINLTQANRIFLLEPSFNPAMVKQAIGRVYRLVSSGGPWQMYAFAKPPDLIP